MCERDLKNFVQLLTKVDTRYRRLSFRVTRAAQNTVMLHVHDSVISKTSLSFMNHSYQEGIINFITLRLYFIVQSDLPGESSPRKGLISVLMTDIIRVK